MTNEAAYIQVATDGTGKKVGNVSITEPQAVDATGNVQADITSYQQKVTLADRRGDLTPATSLGDVLAVLTEMNETLQLILAQLS